MKKGLKIFFGVVSVVVIVLIVVAFLSYRLISKSLPKTSGEITLDALQAPVEVYRDEYGVPHIFAENEHDLFVASGYVTAQDRLWQMDLNRRIASGRLAEIFGQVSLDNDIYLRTWGFRRIANQIEPELSAESRMTLAAYAEGVNAFIENNLDKLPIEFTLLDYQPEKWKIEDSIAFTRLMAWRLSMGWYIEPVLGQLVEKLGRRKAAAIIPGFPQKGPFIISDDRPFWTGLQPFLESGLNVRNFLGSGSGQAGSNSWVVSGEKSVCGKPLLANDPHLALNAPSVWYEMHLSGGDINAAGVALPGVPGVVIGHNQNIAWGLTNGMVDDVDFYVEKINPDHSLQYLNHNRLEKMQVMQEEIQVKNGDPVSLQVKSTRNGTIISSVHPALKKTNTVVAMRWVGQEPSDEMLAYVKILKARNWSDFTEGVRRFKVPAQNFIFASTDGDIGYYLGGTIPIRKNSTGVLPHKGWLDQGRWIGEVPFEKIPHILNPPENYIVTANNKMVSDRYPYYVTYQWEPPSRAARIHERLSQKEKFTIADFQSIQADLKSVHAADMMPILLRAVESKLDSSTQPKLKQIYNMVRDWDFVETPESVATTIFHAWFQRLTENTLKDEMGEELYENYTRLGNVPFRVMAALLREGHSDWFDDVRTEQTETMPDIVVKSLLNAEAWLSENAGEDVSHWHWGQVHTLTMRHPLGIRKPLDVLFNLGPFPRGGSTMTINNAEYRFGDPFEAFLGPSTRQLVDMCDPEHSWSVITTGQSGQRMSEHYKDQSPLWLEGRYHAMVMDRKEIEQSAKNRLILSPKNN